MIDFISIIIPTYNPNSERLRATIEGLKSQTLAISNWEIIIVDNNSTNDFMQYLDLTWHQNSCVLREEKQGLTFARLKGFSAAKGNIIIMVDDDNILDPEYLKNSVNIFNENSSLGAVGGKSVPKFETTHPTWIDEFYGSLALRDLGDIRIIEKWERKYPHSAPIGAGMAIRSSALTTYIDKISNDNHIITDRTGNNLSSGGDNEIIIEILKSGWQIGYFPELILVHIIPEERINPKYLARLINHTNQSWIQLLEKHRINPWKGTNNWSLPLRKFKAWFTYQAWKSEVNYIRWKGACGTLEALAKISKNQ